VPTPAAEFPPAKVNLALHVTGRRPDGYHLLDSLVVFPNVGDLVEAGPGVGLSLALDGPFGGHVDPGADNLVLRAAALMANGGSGAALRLTKNLPVASGIGGGSADAAATLRLLARVWDQPLPADEAVLRLGSDVPACLASRTARMTGVGERLDPVVLPPFWLVLANPGVPVPTAAVFNSLSRRDNPPMRALPLFRDAEGLSIFLAAQRNDLEPPARAVAPAVGEVLAALAGQSECRLARMSGSGATCFGLFVSAEPAQAAAAEISRSRRGWWVVATRVR
jgi:4-diphosphocytidyl-2-C-methyl-D-erythritol kinase